MQDLKTGSRKKHILPSRGSQHTVARIKNLRKSFDDKVVLQDVSFDLLESENLVVLGRSGTGKSVLIKCMIGLMKPDSGSINILGYDVLSLNEKKMNELRQQVGFSFQGSALYDSMSVRENLEFPLKRNLKIHNKRELNDLVFEALENVGLAHAIDLMPAELSGGMKKRVGIARTLILKPKIMLYDEPTAGLDPITSIEINELIMEVREKYNTSSIIITHDISSAKHTSDRIIVLSKGYCKLEGTFEDLKRSEDPEIQPFFEY